MSIQLNFKVRCETVLNQNVFIAGSIKELGQWNVNHFVQLTTNQEIYPMWIGTINAEVEENSLIEFKALIKSDDQTIWEDNENRVIQVRYQKQNIIFSFNSSFVQMIRIASFFDFEDDEPLNLTGIKKTKFKNIICPLDYDDASSNSNEEYDCLSFLDSTSSNPLSPRSFRESSKDLDHSTQILFQF